MQDHIHYDQVVDEVRDYLVGRAEEARSAGIDEVWIDPGIGFGKGLGHNLELLKHLDELVATGWPVIVGTSRKSFLGRLARPGAPEPAPVEDRLEGSLTSAVWAASQGVQMVRVHDVGATVQAMRIVKEAVTV
jgi:dihydropteroate synthase